MKQFIIHGWDGSDAQALERRMASRPAHFEGARKLKEQGHFIVGGAILDDAGKMIGSMMLVQFEDESGIEAWFREEPYILGKVWEKVEVRPFKVADV